MIKWLILVLLSFAVLALYWLFLRKVEETVYPPFEADVGGRTVAFRCAGTYTEVRPMVIKGAPYRIDISVSSPHPDEIELFCVADASIVTVGNTGSKITLKDVNVRVGRPDADKAYYWTAVFPALVLPQGEAHLHCDIGLKLKNGRAVKKEVDWLMAPVKKRYYVNTIVEAIKGL